MKQQNTTEQEYCLQKDIVEVFVREGMVMLDQKR